MQVSAVKLELQNRFRDRFISIKEIDVIRVLSGSAASTNATASRMKFRFFWSLCAEHGVVVTRPPSVHTDGHAPTLEEAKTQFQKGWDAWKAWAKLEEVA